jgi:hypothetical protein
LKVEGSQILSRYSDLISVVLEKSLGMTDPKLSFFDVTLEHPAQPILFLLHAGLSLGQHDHSRSSPTIFAASTLNNPS